MIYLSRIWLNPLRAQTRRLLADPRSMRAAVLGSIPEQPVDPAVERVLWRVDTDNPRRPALFVVSRSKPSWEHLVEQAGWPGASEPQAETKRYDPLLDRLAQDEQYAFRLTANPVENKGRAGDRSARHGHRTVTHQMSWLERHAPRWGFDLPPAAGAGEAPDVRIAARERRSFRRAPGQMVTLQVVTYEGRLKVLDPSALRAALVSGVGPAKAYGCGLLTLAPLACMAP